MYSPNLRLCTCVASAQPSSLVRFQLYSLSPLPLQKLRLRAVSSLACCLHDRNDGVVRYLLLLIDAERVSRCWCTWLNDARSLLFLQALPPRLLLQSCSDDAVSDVVLAFTIHVGACNKPRNPCSRNVLLTTCAYEVNCTSLNDLYVKALQALHRLQVHTLARPHQSSDLWPRRLARWPDAR